MVAPPKTGPAIAKQAKHWDLVRSKLGSNLASCPTTALHCVRVFRAGRIIVIHDAFELVLWRWAEFLERPYAQN